MSKRDAESAQKYMKKCHDRSTEHPDWDPTTPEALIFTSNATVALNPESVVGPYFVAGEYIRSDLTESQVSELVNTRHQSLTPDCGMKPAFCGTDQAMLCDST